MILEKFVKIEIKKPNVRFYKDKYNCKVGDIINMLENSIYSVISPEGCASILWKDAKRAIDAAEALGITASVLKKNKLIFLI